MNNDTGKKKGRSFSLTDQELSRIENRTRMQGYSDRNEYLLALVDADEAADLRPVIDGNRQRVLRFAPGAETFIEDIIRVLRPGELRSFQSSWKVAH